MHFLEENQNVICMTLMFICVILFLVVLEFHAGHQGLRSDLDGCWLVRVIAEQIVVVSIKIF